MKAIFWIFASFAVGVLIFIIGYVLFKGITVVNPQFLFSQPKDMGRSGGILPFIVGTIYLTLISLILAVPLGVGSAIYLAEYRSEGWMTKAIRFGVDCLAGVPSIIFGLFGFIFFVIYLKFGWSILSGGLTVTLMILPFIIRSSEEAIKSVPHSFREVSLSLGSSKWQMVTKVVLPNALPGILTGIILGIGKCVGETASVIFTVGSSLRMPTSLFHPARTMSVHFYILAREGLSMENAYGTAAVLVLFILFINIIAYTLMHRFISRYS
jgi:phosphate transport system permease protein